MAMSRATALKYVKRRIVPVSEAQPHCRVLLYGRNGKGKTRIACGAPGTLVIDVNEEGTKSIRNYPGVDVFHAKKWADVIWAYWFLREGNHDYTTVVVDTLTQLQKLCMALVLKLGEDRDPNRPPKTPAQRDWNQMSERMRPVIFDFRNLPMNVVFVCQERQDKRQESEDGDVLVRYVPDLSPAVRGDAMTSVDIMGRVYRARTRVGKGKKEKIKWETRMLVGDHEDYETKDRTNQLGYIVRNPTMPMLIEASKYIEEEE